jgi:hypothetical protein
MPGAHGWTTREPVQEWVKNDRKAVAQLCADGLGVSLEEFVRLARGSDRDKQTLAAMLKTAGIDPATGRHRSGSVAQAAGIPVPRVGLNDPRVVGADDQGDGRGHDDVRGDVEQLLDAKAG